MFASSATALYAARLIVGVATGASSAIAPMYVGEIAESSVRGKFLHAQNAQEPHYDLTHRLLKDNSFVLYFVC